MVPPWNFDGIDGGIDSRIEYRIISIKYGQTSTKRDTWVVNGEIREDERKSMHGFLALQSTVNKDIVVVAVLVFAVDGESIFIIVLHDGHTSIFISRFFEGSIQIIFVDQGG